MRIPTFEDIRENYYSEQILDRFGIKINEQNKCICPFHKETEPSMLVNKNSVKCFGCGRWLDNFDLTKALLERDGKEVPVTAVFSWFMENGFKEVTRTYTNGESKYTGEVSPAIVEYWFNQMTDEHYHTLLVERLINKQTAIRHRLGYRPDWEALVIPFYRGKRGNSPVDIVQFRMPPDSKSKYLGLGGHNRGSVMNADLLTKDLPYLVVFFGSFDAILARQDGLCAVGLNGSNPFRKDEEDRVKELFKHQQAIYIVPDNTPAEFTSAYKLAEIIGAEVRFFNRELPDNLDYIDYRKMSAGNFLQDVLNIAPLQKVPHQLIESLTLSLEEGKFSKLHIQALGSGLLAESIAKELAMRPSLGPLQKARWGMLQRSLRNVRTEEELMHTLAGFEQVIYTSRGGW